MKHPTGSRPLAWSITIVVVILLCTLVYSTVKSLRKGTLISRSVSNCKQIIIDLRVFGKDAGSIYPDTLNDPDTGTPPTNANAAFRELFRSEIITDERIFGCPLGLAPDGKLGDPSGFNQALLADENHWALTAGQGDFSPGSTPLVFEYPASHSWPPSWSPAEFFGDSKCGPVREDDSVIIGLNDGSVSVIKMEKRKSMLHAPKNIKGKDIFTQSGSSKRILPVLLSPPAQ